MIRKIKQFFSTKEEQKENYEREMRELLRENLSTIAVDMFDSDDPIVAMSPADRKLYLHYFHQILIDKKLIDRLKYLINKQANLTLKNSKDGVFDVVGSSTLNGLTVAKNEIEKLSSMSLKESAELEVPVLDNLRGI